MTHNNNNNNAKRTTPSPSPVEKQTQAICESNENNKKIDLINNDERRKNLSKIKSEELKFIDTSCESDLPPTLSQLQRKSVQISIENVSLSPSPLTPIISLEHDNVQQQLQLNPINNERICEEADASLYVGTNVQAANSAVKGAHDMGVDSAVEDSTVSLEQVN